MFAIIVSGHPVVVSIIKPYTHKDILVGQFFVDRPNRQGTTTRYDLSVTIHSLSHRISTHATGYLQVYGKI